MDPSYGKQVLVYEKIIKPLMYPSCQGIYGMGCSLKRHTATSLMNVPETWYCEECYDNIPDGMKV